MTERQGEHTTPKRVALITGASGGIGQAIARKLVDAVEVLLVAGRNEGCLGKLVEQLSKEGEFVEALVFDVSRPDEVEQAIQRIFQRHKRLDILVNAAGVLSESALMMTVPDALQQTFGVNTFGSLYTAQFASRLMMRSGGGAIINIGSVVAEQGAKGQAVYSASKSALSGLTRSLAKELAPYQIRVNSVAPGFIETELVQHYSDEQRTQLAQKTALGRLGRPEDVAALVTFLCGDGASYITGQTLAVDGMIRL